jgi:membrane associated rhomboid family serine protease
MLLLFLFGDALEKLFGKLRYLLFYLFCGVISVIFYMMTITTSSPILGASGAVFGVLTAYTLLNPNEKINLLFLFPIKIKYFFSIYLLSETFAALGEYDGVAHNAHIGGALGGFVSYLVVKYALNNK